MKHMRRILQDVSPSSNDHKTSDSVANIWRTNNIFLKGSKKFFFRRNALNAEFERQWEILLPYWTFSFSAYFFFVRGGPQRRWTAKKFMNNAEFRNVRRSWAQELIKIYNIFMQQHIEFITFFCLFVQAWSY